MLIQNIFILLTNLFYYFTIKIGDTMNNIILIGMPGCGKSTIGVLLAKILGYNFIDTDLLIQATENKKLYEIINENGIEYFFNAEEKVLSELKAEKCIIATGGSAVYSDLGMQNLKKQGRVVYLWVPLKEIKRRVTNLSTRGVAMKNGQTLADLYKERQPLYRLYADITVECNKKNIADNAKKIIEAL